MSDAPKQSGRLVVVDDEVNMGKILTKLLSMEGYEVEAFSNPAHALEQIRQNPPDLILSDMRMPEMTGDELLRIIHEEKIPTRMVMMTAHGTIENAIECVKLGAFDYVTKPFDSHKLADTVARALAMPLKHQKEADKQDRMVAEKPSEPLGRPMIGSAPAFMKARNLIERAAPSESPVLIVGESGTGKELAARAVHEMSNRRKGPFIAINCASIPENLIESELFGHGKGAFTGAHQLKIGLIEMAHNGTLFLDEIGEMPIQLQAKLLRVLQEHELTRVGESEVINVDIRVVSATNRNLEDCVKEKTFREDLFYRLNVISIRLPALRDRREDIPELAEFFLKTKSARDGREGMSFTRDARDYLMRQQWRGNIRELENAIERAVVMADFDQIDVLDLPPEEGGGHFVSAEGMERLAKSAQSMVNKAQDFKQAREIFERQYLEATLKAENFNVTEAAKRAKMSRRNFYEKLEKLGIDLEELKSTE